MKFLCKGWVLEDVLHALVLRAGFGFNLLHFLAFAYVLLFSESVTTSEGYRRGM